MVIVCFAFFRILNGVQIDAKLRVSAWLEGNDTYLMPCQLKEVLVENNLYRIKVELLDPDRFISKKCLDEKFLFGHPGKVIGYGILKEIENISENR